MVTRRAKDRVHPATGNRGWSTVGDVAGWFAQELPDPWLPPGLAATTPMRVTNVSSGRAMSGGFVTGALVGFLTTWAVGIYFGYVVGDNGWAEAKVAAWLPVVVLGATALWPYLRRATRTLLLGAA